MPNIRSIASSLDMETSVDLTEGREPVLDTADEETLASQCPDVELVFGDNISAGPGVLHLTTRRVVWVSSQAGGPALALRYPQIVMHAISRDPSSYAKPCIYLQLDEGSEDMMQQDDGDEEEEGQENGEEEEVDVAGEVRLVPADESKVDDLFKVLCDCAALNPDSEVEGEGDFFFDEAEVMAGLDADTRAAVMAERLAQGMELGPEAPGAGGAGSDAEEGGDGEDGEDLQQLVGDDPSRFEDDDDQDEAMGQR